MEKNLDETELNISDRIPDIIDCADISDLTMFTILKEFYPLNEYCYLSNININDSKFSNFNKQPPRLINGIPVALRIKKKFMLSDINQYNDERTVKIGICARDGKVFSKPMKEIIGRLLDVNCFEIVIIHDDVVNNVNIKYWPIVHVLISFYSHGFPLNKAIEYAELRKPFLPNDLKMQYILQDRVKIYRMLRQEGIDVPRYSVVTRDLITGNPIGVTVNELDDGIEIDNEQFIRPLVEKPVNADDHNVCIYFPQMMGGGCQRLFRKIGNRSSIYCAEAAFRTNGSYIYEEFLTTDGTDVKVYSVGLEYAHAEARKSPSLDGIVERDNEGKEIRYPVILSAYEKILASKISRIFKQTVCGFDLLRTKGRSCVCDVNGFSFVKKSRKYYDDCASILTGLIAKNIDKFFIIPPSISNLSLSSDEKMSKNLNEKSILELRCVVAIMRHADRTPKQKMKMIVQHEKFISLFKKYGGNEEARLKLKTPKELQDVLNVTRELLKEPIRSNKEFVENPSKLLQMKYVLEMYDKFSGINRKVQLKSLTDDRNAILHKKFKGNNDELFDNKPSLLLILKWGGELTEVGLKQSEELGKIYRNLYPSETSKFVQNQRKVYDKPGNNHNGLLRLHSTYRHDLKIYASDEGRVQLTAASFAKGFLALESSLTSILVHLVSMDKSTTEMLDACNSAEFPLQEVKTKLHNMMKIDYSLGEAEVNELAPTKNQALLEALNKIKNPRIACEKIHLYIKEITLQIHQLQMIYDSKGDLKLFFENNIIKSNKYSENKINDSMNLFHKETLLLMERRWSKLEKDFKQNDGTFNISLIPDIYDCAKYDYLHNNHLGLNCIENLFDLSKSFANAVIPLEYGISIDEKLHIGKLVCKYLLRKIKRDLSFVSHQDSTHRLNAKAHYDTDVTSFDRNVRSRFYFTSESHIYGLFNTFWYGGLFDEKCEKWIQASKKLRHIQEFDFLSQIVFIEYEDPMANPNSPERFHVEIYFSPGNKNKKNTSPNKLNSLINPFEFKQNKNSFELKLSKVKKKLRRIYNPFTRFNNLNFIKKSKDDIFSLLNESYENNDDSFEYDSDGEVFSLRNKPIDHSKIKLQLRKPSNKKITNVLNSRFTDFCTEPLFPLNISMNLSNVINFLDNLETV